MKTDSDTKVFRVGLTGGIGSGKSTVARLFAELGATVVDTDALARELVEPGQPALEEIAAELGPGLLDTAGRLDRARLRELVFADPARRRRLEAILHPRIREAARAREAGARGYTVWVVPLLVEAGWTEEVDRVLVVDLPEAAQRARVAARDGLPVAQIEAILASQASRAQRLDAADDVIDNSGPPETLRARVAGLHRRYLTLAGAD